MFEAILAWFTSVMTWSGYLGFFLIVTAENFLLPVPSELILPFAGYLASIGVFSFWITVLVATVASLAGALLSYAVGRYGGGPFVRRYGPYVLLSEKHLDQAHAWYAKRGGLTVFVCRFIPGVRQLSSIPAGAARMPLGPFCFYTTVGSFFWNLGLIWAGFWLGSSWRSLLEYFKYLDIVVVIAIVIALVWFWHSHGRDLVNAWHKAAMKRYKK